MEQKQKDALWAQYTKQTHRLGRVLSSDHDRAAAGAPFVIGALLGAYPTSARSARGFLSVGLVWTVSSVAEFLIYTPMLGAGGGYLAFITGNLINMKIPCAVNARDLAGVRTGTPENEIVSTLSIATSSRDDRHSGARRTRARAAAAGFAVTRAAARVCQRRPGAVRRDGVSVLPEKHRRGHCAACGDERALYARAGADLVHQLYDHPSGALAIGIAYTIYKKEEAGGAGMKYLLILPGVLVLLVLIAVVRTLVSPRKTSAYQPPQTDEAEALRLAGKLSKMIQVDTTSHAGGDDPCALPRVPQNARGAVPAGLFPAGEDGDRRESAVLLEGPVAGRPILL